MPVQWIPMGLEVNEPKPAQRWTYCSDALAAICTLRLVHPPASYNPRIGISRAPAQMRKNCSTSLKMAERSPPRVTYIATVIDETKMLKLMSHPSTICMTLAMANMLTPLMSTVMNANEIADRARLGSPKRSFKYPGTECVLEM